ncbi:MAG: hypothetical protein WBB65_05310 [Anaerolineales bacterium]
MVAELILSRLEGVCGAIDDFSIMQLADEKAHARAFKADSSLYRSFVRNSNQAEKREIFDVISRHFGRFAPDRTGDFAPFAPRNDINDEDPRSYYFEKTVKL